MMLVKRKVEEKNSIAALKCHESYVYQAAYFIVQDQELALEITRSALYEAVQSADSWTLATPGEQRVIMKRLTMKHAIPVIQRCSEQRKSRIG